MQLIAGSVGQGAANAVSDVALVQAVLLKTIRPAAPAQPAAPGRPAVATRPARPYLASYTGTFNPETAAAIEVFQTDHRLAPPIAQVTVGTVAPHDATWRALLAAVPAAFADMGVLTGHRTVYIRATAAQLQAKVAAVAPLTFAPAFRAKVTATIQRMHADHGIAIGVDPQGDRRTFEAQYRLRTSGRGVTNAGPGESNHNFGMAADLGFDGLRWLRSDGHVVENENSWLREMDSRGAAETQLFWDALRRAGLAVGAFRGPIGDRPHIQNWDDAGVSMAARLADLLTRSGTMRWQGQRGAYSCDLGLGGALIPVGSAVQVWSRGATISTADLDHVRAAAARHPAAPGHPPQAAARPPAAPARPGQPPARPVSRATQADVVAMQQELRRQFDLADANWQAWTPR